VGGWVMIADSDNTAILAPGPDDTSS